jgi:hypothetical protein
MSCPRRIISYSGVRGTRFGFLFCLFALLPLIYYDHLTGTQDPQGHSLARPEPRAPIIEGRAARPLRPRHDPACPICRAASHVQDYSVSTVVLTPDLPSLLRLSHLSISPSRIASLHLKVSGTRAPPVSS